MRFPALPIRSNQDATLNFDKLQKLLTPEPWKNLVTLGYVNAWEDYEAGKRLPEYRKDPFDNVQLRGLIKAGESGKAAFFLPEGYRPKEAKEFIVDANNNTGRISVGSNGEVQPVNMGGEVKVFVYLDAVTFSVE